MASRSISDLAIRDATRPEADAVTALIQRAFAPWVPVVGRRPAPMDSDHAAAIAAGQVRLALVAGRLAGVSVLIPMPDHLELDALAVDPAAQGAGIGRALITDAEALARRLDLPAIRLCTNQAMTSNVALYQRAGFAETARGTQHGFARVFMEKPLR